MALLLKESSDLISAYHQQHHFHHRPHPMPPSFHHPLSSSSSSSSTNGVDYTHTHTPPNPPLVHPTPKYPLDLRTSIIDHPFDAHESAARILFGAINWAKTVPAFVALSNHDQVRAIAARVLHHAPHPSLLVVVARRRLARSLHPHCRRAAILAEHRRAAEQIRYARDARIRFARLFLAFSRQASTTISSQISNISKTY